MYNVILVFHVIVSLALVSFILVQRGRSGGLVEALGGVESIFGTKTSSFFVKATVVLAVLFFVFSIYLAYLSKQQGKSLMDKYANQAQTEEAATSEQASGTLASDLNTEARDKQTPEGSDAAEK
jgi:preprotein translocase subunit SecG